jgi:hypothetical protein
VLEFVQQLSFWNDSSLRGMARQVVGKSEFLVISEGERTTGLASSSLLVLADNAVDLLTFPTLI